jgi:hypothetical protein
MRLPPPIRSLALVVALLGALPGNVDAQLTEEQSPGLRVVYVDTTES